MMDNIEKKYWKIGEVAELINCPASTIRYWETRIDIAPEMRKLGRRFYTKEELERLLIAAWLIIDCGMSLRGLQLAEKRGYYDKIVEFFGWNSVWGYHRNIKSLSNG